MANSKEEFTTIHDQQERFTTGVNSAYANRRTKHAPAVHFHHTPNVALDVNATLTGAGVVLAFVAIFGAAVRVLAWMGVAL